MNQIKNSSRTNTPKNSEAIDNNNSNKEIKTQESKSNVIINLSVKERMERRIKEQKSAKRSK